MDNIFWIWLRRVIADMPFSFEKLSIPEIILVKPKVFADERGFL
jgi:dTDP-4-dehydrorhamnose 3,5-epimerase-like enzyme